MRSKKQKRIMAFYQPQAWINDYAVEVDGACEFDCTDQILKMSADEVNDLIAEGDDSYATDDLLTDRVRRGHNGPFYISVVDKIQDFFNNNVSSISTNDVVTEKMLKEKRKLYGVRK